MHVVWNVLTKKGILEGEISNEAGTKKVKKATVSLIGLSEDELIIGDALDYLEQPTTSGGMPERYRRDVLFESNLTVTDALKADKMLFQFYDSVGAQMKLQQVDIKDMFSLGAEAEVSITAEGRLRVDIPSYLGYAVYSGKTWQERLNHRARRVRGRVSETAANRGRVRGLISDTRYYAVTKKELAALLNEGL